MRRIVSLVTVVAVMAAMTLVGAPAAFAKDRLGDPGPPFCPDDISMQPVPPNAHAAKACEPHGPPLK